MPHRLLLTALLAALLVAGTSCRDENGGPTPGGAILGTPVVFVPVGTLHAPSGIAVDSRGDVWIADTYNNAIRRYASSGTHVQSFPGYVRPGGMGIDRTSGAVLALVGGSTLLRIDPATGSESTVAVLNPQTVDTTAVYDLYRRTTGRRLMIASAFGDVDGGTGGAVYVSALANGNENFVVEVRGGAAKAIAYSSLRVPLELDPVPLFVACNDLGDVFTAFYAPTGSTTYTHRAFSLYPPSIGLSGDMSAVQFPAWVPGGGYDPAGYLMLADASLRQLIIASVSSERVVERITLPAIEGFARPAPTDAAVAPDGSVYVSVRDLLDPGTQPGAVLRYQRTAVH